MRGGLQSCTVQAGFCFGGLTEPKYVSGEITGDSSWVVNSINVLSVNGFTGVVNLEVLGLPAGVTSQTATAVTLDGSPSCCFFGRSGADTPFSLRAGANAALGRSTLTLRATSRAIVHTLSLPINVVDALPAQVLEGLFVGGTVVGGNTRTGSVNVANYVAPAPDSFVTLE